MNFMENYFVYVIVCLYICILIVLEINLVKSYYLLELFMIEYVLSYMY